MSNPLANWWSPEGRKLIFPQGGGSHKSFLLKDVSNRVVGYGRSISVFENLLMNGDEVDDLTDEEIDELEEFWNQ